ncbi:hypothetical protein C2S52_000936 [Perilla frutescens var. hirtella]|nr:hypothetical protein C2S52_000936 [Perilla frutescens var. hirtella]
MKALKIIAFFLFIVANTTSSQNTKCPFQFLYHFGDGISDIGNSVRVLPFGPLLPPTRYPYGKTFPGRPNGRWSDGRVDVDYVAQGVGLPNIKPYLQLDLSTSYDGVIFSVEGSTVLNTSFFNSRRIDIPPYDIPLSTQISWFKTYFRSICTNQRDCTKRQLQNSIVLFEFSEANDIGYALVQGRSIEEVRGYVGLIVQTQIEAAREVISMGATRVVYTTVAPLECYPYILSNDPTYSYSYSYDEVGCLRSVNNLSVWMNDNLQTAFNTLKAEFPDVTILAADFYAAVRELIHQTSVLGKYSPFIKTLLISKFIIL